MQIFSSADIVPSHCGYGLHSYNLSILIQTFLHYLHYLRTFKRESRNQETFENKLFTDFDRTQKNERGRRIFLIIGISISNQYSVIDKLLSNTTERGL